jgi:multiple sugar transport system permease protein
MHKAGYQARLQKWGYIFCLPFVTGFIFFFLWPTLYTVILSFADLKGMRTDFKLVGLKNFAKLAGDKFFWGSVGNTFIISGVSIIFQICVALLLAILLSDSYLNLKGRGLFRALVYMPNLLTAVSISLLFLTLFQYPTGPLSQILYRMGLRVLVERNGVSNYEMMDLFRNVLFTRGIISFIFWLMWYGYHLIILMAGITAIPVSLFESALVDGASSRQTTWFITLPLLRPVLLYVFLTCMIGGINAFDIPAMLTNMRGNPDFKARTTIMYLYNVAFQGSNDYSYGAAIAIGLFLITIVFALFIFFFLHDRSDLKKAEGAI